MLDVQFVSTAPYQTQSAVSKILKLLFPNEIVPELFSKMDIAKILMTLGNFSEGYDISCILEELLIFFRNET